MNIKTNENYATIHLKNSGWHVGLHTDDDGHLNIYLTHEDGSQVNSLDMDIASDETEWGERFTTERIEEIYLAKSE